MEHTLKAVDWKQSFETDWKQLIGSSDFKTEIGKKWTGNRLETVDWKERLETAVPNVYCCNPQGRVCVVVGW